MAAIRGDRGGTHLISIDLTTGAAHALEQETYTQSPCLIAASGGDCWEIGSDPHIGWEMSRIGYSSVTTRLHWAGTGFPSENAANRVRRRSAPDERPRRMVDRCA